MYKVIIWGMGRTYNQYINMIKLQEVLGKIRGGGITGKEPLYEYLDGYKYIPPDRLVSSDFDYVIAASDHFFEEIAIEAEQLGFEREQILPIRIFGIPGFDFDEYIKLLQSHISIFANTCWGGMTYHLLGIKFMSPLINMFESDEDYLKLAARPQYYFGMQLQFDSWGNNFKWAYPICRLDDILLHFNHSKTMDEVEAKWYDRVGRINYENLFVMMCTENRNSLERFADLPYTKKVCFVPFDSTCSCACTLGFVKKKGIPFFEGVNGIASGEFNDYNVISLLNNAVVDHSRILSAAY